MSQSNIGNEREKETYTHPRAALSSQSRGRERELPDDGIRSEYQRDVHRITYSQPFRRLRHKTQVFYAPQNDHICTRLEHSVHVANAARTVARALRLNEDLAEAIGLGHDLGHAPFGHHGEEILNRLCKENDIEQGFYHEVNSLRQVTRLAMFDRPNGEDPGLNLSYEVRDGIVSHDGEEFTSRTIRAFEGDKDLHSIRRKHDAHNPITLEGCIIRVVDKIAYAGRDFADGVRAKLIKWNDMPGVCRTHLGRDNGEIVGKLLTDLIENSRDEESSVQLSQEKFEVMNELIKFNYARVYKHPEVLKCKEQARTCLRSVFYLLMDILHQTDRFHTEKGVKSLAETEILSVFREFFTDMKYSNDEDSARVAMDFLSGATDQFVIRTVREILRPEVLIPPQIV